MAIINTNLNSFSGVANTSNYLRAGVDPQTGTFSTSITLDTLQPALLSGEKFPVTLHYSPLNQSDVGFGKGWQINDGIASLKVESDQDNGIGTNIIVKIPTGEVYKPGRQEQESRSFTEPVSGSVISTRLDLYDDNYQSDVARICFQFISGKLTIVVAYKNGTLAFYTTTVSAPQLTYYTLLTSIVDANGNVTEFQRDSEFRINKIIAHGGGSAEISYNNGGQFIINPNTGEQKTFATFSNSEGLLESVTNTSAGLSGIQWTMDYTAVSGPLVDKLYGQQTVKLLSALTTPSASKEFVEYSTKTPVNDVDTLPHVTRHTQQSVAGNTAGNLVSLYQYADDIFADLTGEPYQPSASYFNASISGVDSAGGHASLQVWQYDKGNNELGQQRADFILQGDDKNRPVFEILSELDLPDNLPDGASSSASKYSGLVYQSTVFTYPDSGNTRLANQAVTTLLTRINGSNNVRHETTQMEYDEQGNLTKRINADGSIDQFSYYPAAGEGDNCPANEFGFIAHLKEETHTPRPSDFATPIRLTRNFYQQVNSGKSLQPVMLTQQENYSDSTLLERKDFSFLTSGNFAGLVDTSTLTLFNPGNTQGSVTHDKYSYALDSQVLTVNTTTTTYDNLSLTTVVKTSTLTGLTQTETDTRGNTTTCVYDKMDRLLSRITNSATDYAVTESWEYGLTAQGSDAGLPLANSACWTLRDDTSRPVSYLECTDGIGRTVSTSIRVPIANNPGGEWFTLQENSWDEFNRLISTTENDYIPAGYYPPYPPVGTTQTFPLRNSKAIIYGYEEGLTSVVTDSTGLRTRIAEDSVAMTKKIEQSGTDEESSLLAATVTVTSDISGNPLQQNVTDAGDNSLLSSASQQYDGLNRVRLSTDEIGNVTTFSYDLRDRIASTTLPDGTTVARGYAAESADTLTSAISVSSQGGPPHSLGNQTFDGLGRRLTSSNGGRSWLWSYSGSSPVPATMTTPAGQKLIYQTVPQLDDALLSVTGPGISNSYDFEKSSGLLISYKNQEGDSVTNDWDPRGLLREQFFLSDNGGTQKTSAQFFSLLGRVLTTQSVDGGICTYDYDEKGRLGSITVFAYSVAGLNKVDVTTLSYDALGRLSEQTSIQAANGLSSHLVTALQYDSQGREINRTVSRKLLNATLSVFSMSSEWRANNQLARRLQIQGQQTLRDESYSYDERNRLVRYSCDGSQPPKEKSGNPIRHQTFIWDVLGNVTQRTTEFDSGSDIAVFTYSNQDPTQLQSVLHTGILYREPLLILLSYDQNGNLTTDEAGRTLEYNALNQLKAVHRAPVAGLLGRTDISYKWGGSGLLAQRSQKDTPLLGTPVTSSKSWYYRDGQLETEIRLPGNNTSRLLPGIGLLEPGNLYLTARDAQDSLQYAVANDNAGGDLFSWSPFGESNAAGISELIGFTGEHRDSLTGCWLLGQRQYNPVLMRFNSPDNLSPFGAGGINPYSYCLGDPINRTDPSGHISGAAIAGVTIGAMALVVGVFTFGIGAAAILAGGALTLSALATASATIFAVASASLGIASAATMDSNPELSEKLGTASLAFGGLSAAASAFQLGAAAGRIIRSTVAKIPRKGLTGTVQTLGATKSGGLFKSEVLTPYETKTGVLRGFDTYRGGSRVNFIVHGVENESLAVIEGRAVNAETFYQNAFGDLPKESYDYIKLYMCHSAEGGPDSFAGQLSKLSGKPVKAYIGMVTVSHNPENVVLGVNQSLATQGGSFTREQLLSVAQKLMDTTPVVLHSPKANAVRFNYPEGYTKNLFIRV